MFEEGDRVIYANENSGYGGPSKNDPLVGTEFFCEGEIFEVYPEHHPFEFYVKWDNGTKNAYLRKDLEFAEIKIKWEV